MEDDELFKLPKGYTDEQLMEEFEAAEAEVEAEGGPQPDPEGFNRLWRKLMEERKGPGTDGKK